MSSQKLANIRALFEKYEIEAYLIPHNDAHNSEYLAKQDERVEFISGFTGSNAICLITKKDAWLWTDARYYIQGPKELEQGWKMMKWDRSNPRWYQIAANTFPEKSKIGFDPLFFSGDSLDSAKSLLNAKNIVLTPIHINLVDEVWKSKPQIPLSPVFIHEQKFVGETQKEKLEKVLVALKAKAKEQEIYYFSAELMEIAWLLNLRGGDIPFNPFFLSYLFLKIDFSENKNFVYGLLFVERKKIVYEVEEYLTSNNIIVKDYEEV